MLYYFCKRCKKDCASNICDQCGQPLPQQLFRFRWKTSYVPMGDARGVLSKIKILFLTEFALILLMYLGEIITASDKANALRMLTLSGIASRAIVFFAAGTILIMVGLFLQGREEWEYVVDRDGAHLRVWIEPTRLRCCARFIRYDTDKFLQDENGIKRLNVAEIHLLWSDTARYTINPRGGRIDLYRPANYRFMTLNAEPEDFEKLSAFIQQKVKQPKK